MDLKIIVTAGKGSNMQKMLENVQAALYIDIIYIDVTIIRSGV